MGGGWRLIGPKPPTLNEALKRTKALGQDCTLPNGAETKPRAGWFNLLSAEPTYCSSLVVLL
jgi:hypothetical protein